MDSHGFAIFKREEIQLITVLNSVGKTKANNQKKEKKLEFLLTLHSGQESVKNVIKGSLSVCLKDSKFNIDFYL